MLFWKGEYRKKNNRKNESSVAWPVSLFFFLPPPPPPPWEGEGVVDSIRHLFTWNPMFVQVQTSHCFQGSIDVVDKVLKSFFVRLVATQTVSGKVDNWDMHFHKDCLNKLADQLIHALNSYSWSFLNNILRLFNNTIPILDRSWTIYYDCSTKNIHVWVISIIAMFDAVFNACMIYLLVA